MDATRVHLETDQAAPAQAAPASDAQPTQGKVQATITFKKLTPEETKKQLDRLMEETCRANALAAVEFEAGSEGEDEGLEEQVARDLARHVTRSGRARRPAAIFDA